MKILLWVGLVLMLLGFGGLLALPGRSLTLPVVWICMGLACSGVVSMLIYGAKTKKET